MKAKKKNRIIPHFDATLLLRVSPSLFRDSTSERLFFMQLGVFLGLCLLSFSADQVISEVKDSPQESGGGDAFSHLTESRDAEADNGLGNQEMDQSAIFSGAVASDGELSVVDPDCLVKDSHFVADSVDLDSVNGVGLLVAEPKHQSIVDDGMVDVDLPVLDIPVVTRSFYVHYNPTEPDKLSEPVAVEAMANHAPVFLGIDDQSVQEDTAFVLPLSVEDLDGDEITYEVMADNSVSAQIIEGILVIVPNDDFSGDVNVEVTASDGKTTVAETFVLTVAAVNDAPEIEDATYRIVEDAAIDTEVGTKTGRDVDGDDLTYRITDGDDAGLFAIDSTTGAITVAKALDYSAASVHHLTVQVSDGNLSSSANVTINVTDVNEAPTGLSLSNTAITENANTESALTIAIIDIVDDALGVETYSLSGDDAANFAIVGNALQLKAGATVDYETQSSYSIVLTATDNDGLTYAQDFTLSVTDVNEAPTGLSLSNTAIAEHTNTESTLTIATIDIVDDALGVETYSLSGDDAANFAIVGNALQLKAGTTVDYDAQSSYSITLTATDNDGLTYAQDFTFEVSSTPELIGALPITKAALGKETLSTFDVTTLFHDADGDALTITMLQGHDWLSMSSADGVTYTLTASPTSLLNLGEHKVTLMATDSSGLSTTMDYTLEVYQNQAPELVGAVSPQTAIWGEEYVHTLAIESLFSDDGGSLTLSAEMPDWLQFNSATNTFTGEPSVLDFGLHSVNVTATDEYGETSSMDFDVNVDII